MRPDIEADRRTKETQMTVRRTRTQRVSRLLALSLAMLVAGALVVTPAVAGKFLTKKKADRRYLGNTSEATATSTFAPSTGGAVTANCPPGLQATGGGADSPLFLSAATPGAFIFTLESRPVISGGRSVGWSVEVFNQSSDNVTVTTHAVCAP
jgi:hypothetical protein